MEPLLESNPVASKYQQWLYKIVEPQDAKLFKKLNKTKSFKYGYNEELDIVVISKDGTVGEIYEIQGLQVGIPSQPLDIHSRSGIKAEQHWEKIEVPKFIQDTKSYYNFNLENSDEVQRQWSFGYINAEFDRRDEGFWFMNNGEPTYLTGSHYMYLQWTKTDAEIVEYRKANQLFHFFWEACKADDRCYGMCYLKNRRSGFSFMASSETVNQATITKDSKYGVLSKRGVDASDLFVDKIVPIALNYPFFFKPIQDGQEKPKSELSFRVPSKRLTERTLKTIGKDTGLGEGLNTIVNWEKTGDYSYDGQKLKLLVHDESGKWEKPADVRKNWRVTKTCLRLGSRIIGKCMMGSTAGALDSGGEEFKEIYKKSDLREIPRNDNGQTPTGLYALFVPMEWNYEGYIDIYGNPVFENPEEPIIDVWGKTIKRGVLAHWNAEVQGLKSSPDDLNEHYRQFPMTENHAFRDESKNSLFNLIRIQEQIDYNDELIRDGIITRGNFGWENGVQDTKVVWHPNKDGKFYITRFLSPYLHNNIVMKDGLKCPGNEHIGAFGCDSYDISGVVGGGGSNGALHGLSKYHLEQFPTNHFFLEYVARPSTAELFYEDVLMAIVFYGMPILVENNKPGLLKHIARRGYRGFSMNRPDKKYSKLSTNERELGGVPNSGPQMIHDHANAINSYIENNVGFIGDGEMGMCYFNRTLMDWARFDITDRTKHDESISSGLAIMANQRLLYRPKVVRDRNTKIQINVGQRGPNGKLIFTNGDR